MKKKHLMKKQEPLACPKYVTAKKGIWMNEQNWNSGWFMQWSSMGDFDAPSRQVVVGPFRS